MKDESPLKRIVDKRILKQLESCQDAIDSGNPGYAVVVCAQLLRADNGLCAARRILRSAQRASLSAENARPWRRLMLYPFLARVIFIKNRDEDAALEALEHVLTKDPYWALPIQLVARISENRFDWETAIFAYTDLCELEPSSKNHWLGLSFIYLKARKWTESIEIAESVLDVDPSNRLALSIIRKASTLSLLKN